MAKCAHKCTCSNNPNIVVKYNNEDDYWDYRFSTTITFAEHVVATIGNPYHSQSVADNDERVFHYNETKQTTNPKDDNDYGCIDLYYDDADGAWDFRELLEEQVMEWLSNKDPEPPAAFFKKHNADAIAFAKTWYEVNKPANKQ
jgi:hypothetical protein